MINESKTTTVGLIAEGHVVLAADKRASAGFMVYHKRVKKIHRVDDYVYMTISGLVADAQFLIDEARFISKKYRLEHGRSISISSLSNYLSLILNYYLRRAPFIVQLIVGGVDYNGPQLYYVDLFGSVSKEKYVATGSGSPIALGILEEGYNDNIKLEEAKKLAYRAVYTAMMRDGFSGEGVDIVIIGPNKVFEETIEIKQELKQHTNFR